MRKPPHVIEIFLKPGDLYFGERNTRIRTVLGSCVSMTFWHPKLLIGGMCHYMLSSRSTGWRGARTQLQDGHYADEAIEMMGKEIDAAGVSHREFQVKLFGGGNMFPEYRKAVSHIGLKNIVAARDLVAKHGFNCVAECLGGDGHRNVIFDVWSGNVWVKHAVIASPNVALQGGGNQVNLWRMRCAELV
jgi:chemotaxis protein CheD